MKKSQFELQILPFKDVIYRLSLSILKSKEWAEDVTQEVILKLWDHKKRLHTISNIKGFVLKMTKNKCLDMLRKKQRQLQIVHLEEDTVGQNASIENMEIRDLVEVAKQAIEQLPTLQRATIQLRDVEGYEFSEIAEILETSESAVRMNLSRARKTIKRYLQKIESHGIK